MNNKTGKLLAAAGGAGIVSLCLRLLLYRIGFDEKNILASSHPLHLACLVLTGFMALFLYFSLRKEETRGASNADFSETRLSRCCMIAAGCLTVFHGASLFRAADTPLSLLRAGLALGAVFSMVICALVSPGQRTLQNLCRGIVTIYFALDMLCRYQDWSGNPQLPDYVFQVFACVLLSLCSYHRLAFGVGLGKRRFLLWSSLMALYLSLTCASGPDTRMFYLGGAFWAGSCICTAEPSAENIEEESL